MNNKQLTACGIIAEYNPFHNGHVYHLQQTKQNMSSDVVVCIMSGNWVQRGEFACLDKWTRAKAVLEAGVDIVVELPNVFAVQAADYFGLGAMKIAKQLQIDELSFGVENLESFQQWYDQALFHTTAQHMPYDFTKSYAQQHTTPHIQLPNQLLAASYVKGLQAVGHVVRILPILRYQTQHNETKLRQDSLMASASAIRSACKQQKDVSSFVPVSIANALNSIYPDERLFWNLLKFQINQLSLGELQAIYQMVEGIEHVFKREINVACDYEDFLNRVQNKRFSKKRIQRLCVYVVLNWRKDDVLVSFEQDVVPLRVLGFSPKGKEYLKQLTENTYTTQLKKDDIVKFQMTLSADKVYEQLVSCTEQNFKRVVRVDENYTAL